MSDMVAGSWESVSTGNLSVFNRGGEHNAPGFVCRFWGDAGEESEEGSGSVEFTYVCRVSVGWTQGPISFRLSPISETIRV